MPTPELIALTGPTAAGKTAAALAVAERWPVEIISVDSALVYRGMELGTAKPSAQELAGAVHHLIDIRDPLQPYSAAEFRRDALRLIEEIRARGHRPLLVGGSMLYLKALMDGLDDMPPAMPSVREHIAEEAAAQGWPALHAELAAIDPLTAARLAPMDAQRIARALEVWRVSGRTLSSFHQQAPKTDSLPIALISLEPDERAWLHERIASRFDQMLAQGLLEEVWGLMQRGDLHPDLPAMRCVGYRQCWQALQELSADPGGKPPALSPAQLQALRSSGIAATRQLAKRQITWLRSMAHRQVVACDAPDALAQVLARVQTLWGSE
ncbi:MAG: tRNA (adenosine(37)-N6)-dimethylallyltransferase MiaA [Betaproteobacteria bacterium]